MRLEIRIPLLLACMLGLAACGEPGLYPGLEGNFSDEGADAGFESAEDGPDAAGGNGTEMRNPGTPGSEQGKPLEEEEEETQESRRIEAAPQEHLRWDGSSRGTTFDDFVPDMAPEYSRELQEEMDALSPFPGEQEVKRIRYPEIIR